MIGAETIVTRRGFRWRTSCDYNQSAMLTASDAAQKYQFACSLCPGGRVLAALTGVSKAVSGQPAFAAPTFTLR
jgi:hypothetical protein